MKKILSLMLSLVLVISLVTVSDVQKVQAYGIDYNFVDNVLGEVGYGDWYDDSLDIIESSYNCYGGFNFSSNMPARYLVSTSKTLNGKTVITPMTESIFTQCSFNVEYGKTQIEIKPEMTEEQIVQASKTYLKQMWDENESAYAELDIDLTSSGNFAYAAYYNGKTTNVSGNTLAFIGINDSTVTNVTIKASATSNIGDYAFANYKKLKDISFSLEGKTQEFPYAFCYGCSNLKYLTYPQNNDYTFEKYAFAKCTALIHWTGLGKNGATQNWNNTTTPDSVYEFCDYAFANCTSITHIDIVSSNVTLNDYAFGNSGLTYIGFFDYNYYDNGDSLLDSYKEYANALMAINSISDKAFDGVKSERIYVAHKDIYDILNMYQDGKYCQRTLVVANIKVSFDGTDTTAGEMEDVVIRYDDDIYVMTNKFEKTGCTFVGFSSEIMGSAVIEDNYNAPHNGTDWITSLCCDTGVTTLYPIWDFSSYSIRYVLNGGSDEGINLPDEHVYGEVITTLEEPTRSGYDFDGWFEDEELTVPFSGISATDTTEHIYYAKWKAHDITITYVLDGGKNHPDNPETLEYDSPRIELKEPSKDGYDFAGWTTGDNDEKVTYLLAANGDQTLYATWKVHTYKISYELNGGTLTGEAPTSYEYGTMTYLMVPPVKEKYRFMGWYSDKELTKRVYDIGKDSFGDITLYAKWSETVAILDIPSKEGYRFIGWVDGNEKSISNTELLSSHEGDIYANYLDIRWTIVKKGTKTYVNTLKADYEWYAKREKKGDSASFQEQSKDGSIVIYGTADGYVTKKDLSINISGKITSISLKRNGKKVSIPASYFNKKSDEIYLKGYPITKNGVYVLTVNSATDSKTVTFMKDDGKPTVTGIAKKTVKTTTKLDKKVKKAKTTTKKKGKTTTTVKKKGKKKIVTKVTKNTFKITQKRRFYVDKQTEKTDSETVTTKYTAFVKWKDSVSGVSTVYINGKKLSAKKVKKGQYELKKAGTYTVEVYDYLGNQYSQKIVLDDENSDVTLPKCNLKNNTSYYEGTTLKATDKSGISKITVKDWHGFTHTYKSSSHTFNNTGTYKVTVYDKAGNYKKLKIKIVKKPKY